jgi:hypothetical protein
LQKPNLAITNGRVQLGHVSHATQKGGVTSILTVWGFSNLKGIGPNVWVDF